MTEKTRVLQALVPMERELAAEGQERAGRFSAGHEVEGAGGSGHSTRWCHPNGSSMYSFALQLTARGESRGRRSGCEDWILSQTLRRKRKLFWCTNRIDRKAGVAWDSAALPETRAPGFVRAPSGEWSDFIWNSGSSSALYELQLLILNAHERRPRSRPVDEMASAILTCPPVCARRGSSYWSPAAPAGSAHCNDIPTGGPSDCIG